MDKKIGILTFHNVYNYGANLQAYALKQYLLEQGYRAEIIDYHNGKLERQYCEQLSPWFAVRKRDWILPWRWKNVISSWRWYQKTKGAWELQSQQFVEFQRRYLDYTNEGVKTKDIAAMGYDIIIFGSDQIWDTGITGKHERCYWGDSISKVKKISYAASLYSSIITRTEEKNIRKYLPKFDYLSVREEHLAETIRELIGREVDVVCDPTLLLTAQRYYRLIGEKQKKERKPYILVYMVSEGKQLIDVAMQYGYPVKVLHYYVFQTEYNGIDEDIANAGPIQFLELLRDAQGIVTNSYHGTVFSILFQKPFTVVYEKNARIEHLLKTVDLEDAHYSGGRALAEANTDNLTRLNAYTEESKIFLKRSIEDV